MTFTEDALAGAAAPTGAPRLLPTAIAYLSPEFGLDQSLPLYSGGLGILAGDHLKAAADLGLPVIGVGLLYREGYFRQVLDAEGHQSEVHDLLDPIAAGLEIALAPDGAPAQIAIDLPDGRLHARIWLARHGGVRLYLLDTDLPANTEAGRAVTDRLYGGDIEHRIRQEILLGVGGVRALAALGIDAEVFHSNEGHAGFMGIERIRVLVEEAGLEPAAAIEAVRAGTVFTTHTPVPAGIDRFPNELVERYFGTGSLRTGIDLATLLEIGADPDEAGVFNMAAMGIRLAGRVNGVSRLHGDVSRLLFQRLWRGLAVEEVPIGYITNGVHAPTWVGPAVAAVLERHVGPRWASDAQGWGNVRGIDDAELWAARNAQRRTLVEAVRVRLAARGLPHAAAALDPEALTIGFARRVPTYKRLTLMLRERDRLVRLLTDADRPVQLVVAGKAHPRDEGGKRLLAEFGAFAASPEVRGRVVLLSDYDMTLGALLTQGCDAWLNTPLRPYEACGTSGMKSALNAGLNVSILDGWWDELHDGLNGWAIPSSERADLSLEDREAAEATALLALLEDDVVPAFYQREGAVPRRWLGQARGALATIGPRVLATRMVNDYLDGLYLPAAADARRLGANGHAGARTLGAYVGRVRAAWDGVHVVAVERRDASRVHATVALGTLAPGEVRVEAIISEGGRRRPAGVLHPVEADADGRAVFVGALQIAPEAGALGVRVIPHHPDLADGLGLGLVRSS
jgi:starch phosphorylase